MLNVVRADAGGVPAFPPVLEPRPTIVGNAPPLENGPFTYSDEGNGHDKGAIPRDFPPPSSGVALLSSFYFLYTDGGTFNPIDKHLQQMLLMPNEPMSNQIWVGYHDERPNEHDDEFYFHFSYLLVTAPELALFDSGVIFGTGSSTQPIPPLEDNHVFVLMGFDIGYRADDHHVNQIGILEDGNNVTAYFNDENSDDLIQWRVKYASVPANMFTALGEVDLTRQHSYAQQSIPSGPAVIRGFFFDFQPYFTSGEDHHIRDVGVLSSDGIIQIALADDNGDDGFDCKVKWGILAPIPSS
jgi:hypothetical protein